MWIRQPALQTEADPDADAHSDAGSYADPDANTDAQRHAHPDPDTGSYADAGSHADANADAHCDAGSYADPDANTYAQRNADPDAQPNANSDAHTNPDARRGSRNWSELGGVERARQSLAPGAAGPNRRHRTDQLRGAGQPAIRHLRT